MKTYRMAGRYDTLLSLFSILSDEKAAAGRNQDLRRSSFTLHDVADVKLANNILSLSLKDGRSWQGRPDGLTWSEIEELHKWAEVKAVEESLGLGTKRGRNQSLLSPAEADPCGHVMALKGASRGAESKKWRDFDVDVDLEEDWLERMNRIPDVEILATCQGHPESSSVPSSYLMFIWRRPEASYDATDGQQASFDDFMRRYFGDIAEVAFFGDPHARYSGVRLEAPALRAEMTNQEFRTWWLTVLERLEALPGYM